MSQSLTFAQAAEAWSQSHALHIAAGTQRHYRCCIAALTPFFGAMKLSDIHIDMIEEYQKRRSSGDGLRKAGPSCVNHEVNCLSQILSRANLWDAIEPHYRAMPLPRPKVGRALTDEEQQRLFDAARSNRRWTVAYYAAIVSSNTACGPNEIRNLRLGDIDLEPPTLHIQEGTKNKFRVRDIPLNEDAALAVRILLNRAKGLGASAPEHYLLPHRASNGSKGFDPTRPISSWRTVWEKLRVKAGLPKLRMYDLRHDCITRLLEDENISERTTIELAGHVSRAMLDRYSHVRMKTKRQAVDALVKKKPASEKAIVFFSSTVLPIKTKT